MRAAFEGYVDAIEVLLTGGALINEKDKYVSDNGFVGYYDNWYTILCLSLSTSLSLSFYGRVCLVVSP